MENLTKNQSNILINALLEYGTAGIPGIQDNQRVLEYFKESGNQWVRNDETAWCSAFISYIIKKSGLPYSKGLNARAWLNFGTPVTTPKAGDIVILWRINPQSVYGHVGVFIKENAENIYILGGNQSNKVCIALFPKSQVLGYRQM